MSIDAVGEGFVVPEHEEFEIRPEEHYFSKTFTVLKGNTHQICMEPWHADAGSVGRRATNGERAGYGPHRARSLATLWRWHTEYT